MDKAEKIGLGTAVGGHLLLFGALSLGLLLSTERIKKPEALSVSLVGEVADVSTAPDAIQEESAPPSAGETTPTEPPPAPETVQIEKPVEKPIERPVERPIKHEVTPPAKTAIKKVPVKQPPPAKAVIKKPPAKQSPARAPAQTPARTPAAPAKSGKGTKPAKPGGFSKNFEDAINNVGKAPGAGKAVGTPASKSAAEVRRAVSVSLASQIRSRVRACAPSGIDINQIETYVTLNLDATGRLTNVSYNKQTGINDSNQPQAGPLKDCILRAVRAASPYSGLDPAYHNVWKTHALRLRATG